MITQFQITNWLPSSMTATIAACSIALAAPAIAQDAYPSADETLDWTIAFGPGGGNDIMARTIINILTKYDLYPGDIAPENRAGGSGAVGWGYLFSQDGESYGISTTSGSFVTTPLQADTPWQPEDFTPVALLATDDLVLVVNGDSKVQNIDQFIEMAKANPMNIGGTGTVNVDFIVPSLFAQAAGFEFDYVSFNSMADQTTALLSGALDSMVSNPGEVLGLIESGELRPLVYSGQSTPAALGDVPTMGDIGFDIGVSMPRGLILAPNAPNEVQQWWIETMKQVVETPEWATYIESNTLTPTVIYGEEFRDFLVKTKNGFETVLISIGAID
ncbi:putative TTT-family transporter periplasmatic substrate-binding protein TctC (plasmid) [Octadecabacter antarcticus 307]|uniref:Putative TTT-family transporter periplasmatic substrate-binding protein TctC n=1 Tax=Octadecabacter antarcticus 307 TaxID=391626 RepID=M9RDI8_9RHOB|nr:tripartite tricarboxylate transporter substrate-binding protein [Octadecabacter antarcticus]AGI70257.1 putative TTT-family transporter periplasmatic substrate-binding protein TctC [Octadecabacter antarcticus 307]